MEDLLQLACQPAIGHIDWEQIQSELFRFAGQMSRTQQNPVFHGEGNVWTHTKLVCEALAQQDSFRKLPEHSRQGVFLAALLHDVGKIPTTRWEDDRWTSPNHSFAGSAMAREFLWQDLGLCGTPENQQLRETVCNLIRYHSFPPHAIDDPDGKRKLIAIAANGQNCPLFSVKLLCVLCEADALGRICSDREHMLEQIHLCAELAKESGCYDSPFAFPSAHTGFSYLSGKDIVPEMELYDDTWGEIILMSGLPGTGKDTWIREHCPDLPMISLDDIRREAGISPTDNQSAVAEIARERAKTLLRKKQPFVWNATNLSPMIRSKQVRLFSQYGASTRIVYLETGVDEQLRRNSSRPDAVPEPVIHRMTQQLIPPEAKEAHRVEWHCV